MGKVSNTAHTFGQYQLNFLTGFLQSGQLLCMYITTYDDGPETDHKGLLSEGVDWTHFLRRGTSGGKGGGEALVNDNSDSIKFGDFFFD